MKAVHCIPPQEVKEYKKLDEQLQYQVKVERKKIRWKEAQTHEDN